MQFIQRGVNPVVWAKAVHGAVETGMKRSVERTGYAWARSTVSGGAMGVFESHVRKNLTSHGYPHSPWILSAGQYNRRESGRRVRTQRVSINGRTSYAVLISVSNRANKSSRGKEKFGALDILSRHHRGTAGARSVLITPLAEGASALLDSHGNFRRGIYRGLVDLINRLGISASIRGPVHGIGSVVIFRPRTAQKFNAFIGREGGAGGRRLELIAGVRERGNSRTDRGRLNFRGAIDGELLPLFNRILNVSVRRTLSQVPARLRGGNYRRRATITFPPGRFGGGAVGHSAYFGIGIFRLRLRHFGHADFSKGFYSVGRRADWDIIRRCQERI